MKAKNLADTSQTTADGSKLFGYEHITMEESFSNLFLVQYVWFFHNIFYSGWISKRYEAESPVSGRPQKKTPSFSCTLHIFQTYNYELLREAYLERFVVGSFMTKHSFNSPYLLKYSLNPSEKMESKTTSLRQWKRKICFALIGRAAVTRDSSQQTKQ